MNELSEIVHAAAVRPEVVSAVWALYARLAERIAERKPVCIASGRCCRFETFGHRLFVTAAELAAFLAEFSGQNAGTRHPAADRLAARFEAWDGSGCPFQVNRLCQVHEIKPMGCRLFFCDSTSTEWQQQQYELFHEELKAILDSLALLYRYVEWRTALRALFEAGDGAVFGQQPVSERPAMGQPTSES